MNFYRIKTDAELTFEFGLHWRKQFAWNRKMESFLGEKVLSDNILNNGIVVNGLVKKKNGFGFQRKRFEKRKWKFVCPKIRIVPQSVIRNIFNNLPNTEKSDISYNLDSFEDSEKLRLQKPDSDKTIYHILGIFKDEKTIRQRDYETYFERTGI